MNKSNEKNITAAVEPEAQSNPEIDKDFSFYQSITLSRSLSHEEALQLLKSFVWEHDSSITKETIIHDDGKWVKVSVKGYEYRHLLGMDWEIKKHTWTTDGASGWNYTLDIIIYSNNRHWPVRSEKYEGKVLWQFLDSAITEETGRVPFLADLDAYKLTQACYNLDIYTEGSHLLNALYKYYYTPSDYIEWETFAARPSQKRSQEFMVKRRVHVSIGHYGSIIAGVRRTFDKDYPLRKLCEHDSANMRLILKQILSVDYAMRSALTYLMFTVMGGAYCSMERASEIIESSGMDEEGKRSLLNALRLVYKKKGIRESKLLFRDDRKALIEFNNNLHELVSLGINPAIIPEEFDIPELPNPVSDLYKKYGAGTEDGSRIEVEEAATVKGVPGTITLHCRLEA